jgi:hypothetical protein
MLICISLLLAGCVSTEGRQAGENGADAGRSTDAVKTSETGKMTGPGQTAVTVNSADSGNLSPETMESEQSITFSEQDLLRFQDRLNEIVKSGDVSKCKELTVQQFFVTCEVDMLSAQAKSADDTQVCDKASKKEIKDRCVAQVKLKTP